MSHYTTPDAPDDVIEGLVTSEKRLTALGIAPAAWWCWTDSDIAKAERKARRARRC